MTARAESAATHVRTNLSKLHTLSMDYCAQEALHMSFFFDLVHNDNSTIIQAPWQRTMDLCKTMHAL